MKKLSKFFALLLALAMLAAVVACENAGNPTENPTAEPTPEPTPEPTLEPALQILGTWNGSIDFTDMVNKSFEEEFGAAPTTEERMIMNVSLTFKDDGTVGIEYDTEAIASSFEAYMSSIIDFIKDAVYQQLIDQGIGTSVEEIDAFMESIGYTMDQFIQETFGALDFASLISEDGLPSSNVYKIEDGKLYMEDSVDEYQEGNYAEFTINANTLTFTEIYEDGKPTEEMREILPLVFDRVG